MKRILTVLVLGMSLQMAMAQDSTTIKKTDRFTKGQRMHQGGPMKKHFRDGGRQSGWMNDLNLTEAQQLKMKELRNKHKAEMMAVLTPEQTQQLQKKKAERMQMRAERAKAGMDRMKKNLNLTDEQVARMEQLNKEFRQQSDVIRANEKLAGAQQQQKLQALRQAHRENMKAILTPEQKEMMKQRAEKRRPGNSR
ncbi:hypothetical protein ACFSQD_09090 [Flavihumibacter stibioxidans]|uniref:LTXXQ motif family protein n=1 Tax=Flavihumibacter stibioxidans TaxID=1834163 RepID=A0ABR7M620_9BACT|nr:hypothetical protein [Flavihumibacter stibioxidans]MBC6490467.1 hypothetical protein [Flavihumibacter stibioxidans]